MDDDDGIGTGAEIGSEEEKLEVGEDIWPLGVEEWVASVLFTVDSSRVPVLALGRCLSAWG